ncbi:MAG: serine hydrolase, partial [Burkholderiales bacterium PBB4]
MTMLAIQNVSLQFGGVQALAGASFDIDRGTLTGLIGPNGYTTTIASLLKRAMTQSDNTANDFLMRRVGGPNAIRELIASKRLGAIRFGPGERHFQAATAGLGWKPEYSYSGAFNSARAALSPT